MSLSPNALYNSLKLTTFDETVLLCVSLLVLFVSFAFSWVGLLQVARDERRLHKVLDRGSRKRRAVRDDLHRDVEV